MIDYNIQILSLLVCYLIWINFTLRLLLEVLFSHGLTVTHTVRHYNNFKMSCFYKHFLFLMHALIIYKTDIFHKKKTWN